MTVPSIIIVPCEFFCRIGSAMIVTPSATTNRPVAPPQAFNFLCILMSSVHNSRNTDVDQ
ncbi:Uncharacterised protein [Vibrio cholerae]|nr:Uncharacterised protein [Vibrio cholerae]